MIPAFVFGARNGRPPAEENPEAVRRWAWISAVLVALCLGSLGFGVFVARSGLDVRQIPVPPCPRTQGTVVAKASEGVKIKSYALTVRDGAGGECAAAVEQSLFEAVHVGDDVSTLTPPVTTEATGLGTASRSLAALGVVVFLLGLPVWLPAFWSAGALRREGRRPRIPGSSA